MKNKKYNFILLLLISTKVLCAQGNVVQRNTLEPKDAAVVKSVQAKKWIGFGIGQQAQDSVKSKNSIGNGVNCTTNVGGTPDPKFPHPLGNSKTQPNVVVVTGSVINVCG